MHHPSLRCAGSAPDGGLQKLCVCVSVCEDDLPRMQVSEGEWGAKQSFSDTRKAAPVCDLQQRIPTALIKPANSPGNVRRLPYAGHAGAAPHLRLRLLLPAAPVLCPLCVGLRACFRPRARLARVSYIGGRNRERQPVICELSTPILMISMTIKSVHRYELASIRQFRTGREIGDSLSQISPPAPIP